MNAITYRNTKTALPGWIEPVHLKLQRGYAYETDQHFIHIYGSMTDTWWISIGATAHEKKPNGVLLTDWVRAKFGAEDIQMLNHAPGEVISSVWRPGLQHLTEIYQALNTQEYEQRAAEQSLRILLDKLDDILLYIEPTANGLLTYGHKTRELLILACTEVENNWTQYMKISNSPPTGRSFTTNDYVKLLEPLCLAEYQISFKQFNDVQPLRPFERWNKVNPTQSLPWYEAYNKTKHDRGAHFSEATLENCLHALSAAIALFCARYSPIPLIFGNGSAAALFNQHFSIQLSEPNPQSFYVPLLNLPENTRSEFICGERKEYVVPWTPKPLVL